jgi:RNA-directed DNA polymerase
MSDKAITKAKRQLKRTNQRNSKGAHFREKLLNLIQPFLVYKITLNMRFTIYMDLTEVNYSLRRVIRTRLRNNMKHMKFCETSVNFKRKTKGIQPNTKIYVVQNTPLLPVTGIHHKTRGIFSQVICNYTETGRNKST